MAGYNTWKHGSHEAGTIDATHIETHYDYLVKTGVRQKYSKALAESIKTFMEKHYGFRLKDWRDVQEAQTNSGSTKK